MNVDTLLVPIGEDDEDGLDMTADLDAGFLLPGEAKPVCYPESAVRERFRGSEAFGGLCRHLGA